MTLSVRRIRYVGLSPEAGPALWKPGPDVPNPLAAKIGRSVQTLNPVQREIIERRFWRGQTLTQIGRALDLSSVQVRRELRRGLATLRRRVATDANDIRRPGCRLCTHPRRMAIDRLLRQRRPTETWRGYLKRLSLEFGIRGLPAKALQSHINTHTLIEEKPDDVS